MGPPRLKALIRAIISRFQVSGSQISYFYLFTSISGFMSPQTDPVRLNVVKSQNITVFQSTLWSPICNLPVIWYLFKLSNTVLGSVSRIIKAVQEDNNAFRQIAPFKVLKLSGKRDKVMTILQNICIRSVFFL